LEDRVLLSVQTDGHTAIVAKYAALGGSAGFLANPTGSEALTTSGLGVYQYYQGGIITWSASTSAHEVHGAVVNRYNELGGPNGTLGLSATDEVDTPNYDGRVNTFEHGLVVYNYASAQTSAVQGSIATEYFALGGMTSFLSLPTANEADTPNHDGRISTFQGGIITYNASAGTHEVHGAIVNCYNGLGATTSYLGFPTSDEVNTPTGDGRMNTFQGGTIVYTYATGVTTATPTPVATPTIDVLTPPTFREGDVFSVTVMDATPGQSAGVTVVGDNNATQYSFPSTTIDVNGNATLALRMPYVLAKGYTVDGRTLRVTTGSYTQDFQVTVNEGLRVSLSTDNIQENSVITVNIRNGIGSSQVIVQLTHDNNEVKHEWGYLQTDGSGKGTYNLTIPTVLSGSYRVDGFGFRVITSGITTEQKITITEGLRVVVGASRTREYNTFPMEVRNGPANTNVTLAWYLDASYRTTQTFRTDGSGHGSFTVVTPHPLILNSATQDTFRLVATVNGRSFTFSMLVYKYISPSQPAPDPGSSQPQSAAPAANKTNTALGVVINTPAKVDGTKNVRAITPQENPTLAAKDPVVTVKDQSKHQLVILCYGSDQHPGDNAGSSDLYARPGMDEVNDIITNSVAGGHIVRLWSGNKLPWPWSLEPLNKAKDTITATIDTLNGIGHTINSVVIAGYSWGGGMAKDLCDWINNTYNPQHNVHIQIAGLVYVDAVCQGDAVRETYLPQGVSSFLNIYQSILDDSTDSAVGTVNLPSIPNPGLPGYDGTGLGYYGRYREFDCDTTVDGRKVNVTNHGKIDNYARYYVAEFITSVLNGWYWTHV